MPISRNLPMITLDTFSGRFAIPELSLDVRFESKTQSARRGIVAWLIIIEHFPKQGRVQYLLVQNEKGGWEKAMGLNVIQWDLEDPFLHWAVNTIDSRKPGKGSASKS